MVGCCKTKTASPLPLIWPCCSIACLFSGLKASPEWPDKGLSPETIILPCVDIIRAQGHCCALSAMGGNDAIGKGLCFPVLVAHTDKPAHMLILKAGGETFRKRDGKVSVFASSRENAHTQSHSQPLLALQTEYRESLHTQSGWLLCPLFCPLDLVFGEYGCQ